MVADLVRGGGTGKMSSLQEPASVLAGLKDFQRATVDYVFERFYGEDPTRMFLVADEVGLGKTLVARGITARIIEHLKQKSRIDIVYICSNADIARQNIQRLRIAGNTASHFATRLTMLPLITDDLRRNRMNLIALTPQTSFQQSGDSGRVEERVLLYWLLDAAWGIHGLRSSIYVMQANAPGSFEGRVKAFDPSAINEEMATTFRTVLTQQPELRTRFDELRSTFGRSNSNPSAEARRERSRWIGDLRHLLARVCLTTLKPDLVILDEFQRFNRLLDEDSDEGELARDLFGFEEEQGARILLLSATPYRAVTLHHETEDDHHSDFLWLVGKLENSDASECKELLRKYRAALPDVMSRDGLERLRRAKEELQGRLLRVMVRTERLGMGRSNGEMLLEVAGMTVTLKAQDVRGFMGTQQIAEALEQGDIVEYWKSAPYLLNFMDNYALKRAFKDAKDQQRMIALVRKFPEAFLQLSNTETYDDLEPANPRLRELMEGTTAKGLWRLLWIPPSLPYYQFSGAFGEPDLQRITKRLIFSSWHMVPRAVASFLSYEAEKRMMRSRHPEAQITQDDWKAQRGLLRFRSSSERLGGMPLFLFVYPCLSFARECDPRNLARDGLLTAAQAQSSLAASIRGMLDSTGFQYRADAPKDERWYWLAPMLLDAKRFPSFANSWWERTLARNWSETAADDDGWISHVKLAVQTMHDVLTGESVLGSLPEDLFEILALAASAGPATAALRAFERIGGHDDVALATVADAAASVGRAFLSLFNHAEVIEMIRSNRDEPYWERALIYAHEGCIQAMLDEYCHILRESLGFVDASSEDLAKSIAEEIVSVLILRSASLRIDEVTAPPYARAVTVEPKPMRVRFAMRFGDDRSDEVPDGLDGTSTATRKEKVRAAFNSPFWPFVLVSTSVGQEGLDFHFYCHAITHWNLPANPVDLEQREGRIHRYKGHAVRKNIADKLGLQSLAQGNGDVWSKIFTLGREQREPYENDLVPYWVYSGNAKIERHVPVLPLSRDGERLYALRRSLAIYRMVFGQNRQEDLIDFLLTEIPEDKREGFVQELQIDLRPPQLHPSRS
jgi:hypothetical protein